MEKKKLSKEERLKVYRMFDGRCAYCGKQIAFKDMQVDHIVPLHLGGADDESNWYPACRMCNHYKSKLTLEKFRQELSKLPEMLENVHIYRLARMYGLIRRSRRYVRFYFEQEALLKEWNEHKDSTINYRFKDGKVVAESWSPNERD